MCVGRVFDEKPMRAHPQADKLRGMRNAVSNRGGRGREGQRKEGPLRGVGIEEWLEVGRSCADSIGLTGVISAKSIKIPTDLTVDKKLVV